MLAVVLTVILAAITTQGRKISIIDILTNTQQSQQSHGDLDQANFASNAQEQYKLSGMDTGESPISQSTMMHIANECKTPSIHKQVEDHVFMALFENINTGCTQVQDIWDQIPSITDEQHLNEIINNISYAITNKSFNESVKYGIHEDVIITISIHG